MSDGSGALTWLYRQIHAPLVLHLLLGAGLILVADQAVGRWGYRYAHQQVTIALSALVPHARRAACLLASVPVVAMPDITPDAGTGGAAKRAAASAPLRVMQR